MQNVFDLVKSLTGAELAYIKRTAIKVGQRPPKYIEVLEAIKEQEIYDEQQLLKQFRREKFVKQFSVMKSYLVEVILDGLAARQIIDNREMNLHRQISLLRVLRDKGLYGPSEKILHASLKEAREAEAFLEWLEILAIQRYWLINKFSSGSKNAVIENEEETDYVLNLYKNFLTYQCINGEQVQISDKSFHIRRPGHLAEHEKVMAHPMILDESKALSKRAMFELLMTKVLYHNILDNREEFFENAQRAFTIAHESLWLQKFDKLRLLSVYPQLMHAAFLTDRLQVLDATINQLKKFEFTSAVQEMAAFAYGVPYSLVYLQATGQSERLSETINETYLQVKKFGKQLRFDTRSQIIISCMSGALENGNYGKAVDWAVLFNDFDNGERLDTRLIVDMMELIAHNELGQVLLVHNLSQSIYQRALRWGEKGIFEDTFIRFFKKITSGVEKEKMDEVCKKTMIALEKILLGGVSSQNRTLYPLFVAYVQCRIVGKPYHVYLRQQAISTQ